MRPYYQDDAVTLYHGDCLDILPTLDPVDHVITDPPYSEHVHSKSMRGADGWLGPIEVERDLGFASVTDDDRTVVMACHPRRWTLVFSDVESTHRWRESAEGHVEYVRTGAWVKVGGAPQFTGDRPAVGFEAISIFHQPGRKAWNGGGRPAVWSVPIVLDRGNDSATEWRCHTAQKPERLMEMLVAEFTDPGEVILDPFAGSGTTGVAAKRLGRRAILIEREERYCEVAVKRLRQGALPLELGA